MADSAARPLQPPHEERLARLSRHFVEVVEPLLEAGEHYADLTVERLIKAGGISRSTFYVYFSDKADLLSAMAVDVTAVLAEAGGSWFSFPNDGDKDELREALRPLFATYRRHHAILGAIADLATHDARVRVQHRALVQRAVDELTEHIAAAQRDGAAAPDIDARLTAEWLTWMHERGLHQLVATAADDRAEELLGGMTDLVWRTLYEGYRRPAGRR